MNWQINGIIGVILILISGILLDEFKASATSFELVSVAINGSSGNFPSFHGDLSEDGRYVAFMSFANNLIEEDRNREGDIFLRDRVSGTTTLVSRSPDINGASDESNDPSISGDGRFVVFVSPSRNLVSNDTNRVNDVFLFDRDTGEIKRITISNTGQEADGESFEPFISLDGSTIVFFSKATNLDSQENNGNIFIHNLKDQKTTGLGITGFCRNCNNIISNDGRYIAFESEEWLVNQKTSSDGDVFVYDQLTGEIKMASTPIKGGKLNNYSTRPYLSENGMYVSFSSETPNLVENDLNLMEENIFVRDLKNDSTLIASINEMGEQVTTSVNPSAISSDGRLVAFSQGEKIFVYDTESKKSQKYDVDGVVTSISGDGKYIAFYTRDGLVPEDTNHIIDVYVLEISSTVKHIQAIPETEKIIPTWIREHSSNWSMGELSDDEFFSSIKFLIQQKIIELPQDFDEKEITNSKEIPAWIKKVAGWWSEELISDKEFVNGIKWLITNKVMMV